jgi:cytochrome c556
MKPILFIPFLFILTACADSTSRAVTDTGQNETGQPALHAIHDQQLHELMGRMNSLMQERFMTEPELDAERRKYAQRVAKTAQNMLQTLDAILATTSTLKLNKTDETTFQALTEQLRKQTQELQQQGDQNRMDAIPNTLEQMKTTCTSCHALFRKL